MSGDEARPNQTETARYIASFISPFLSSSGNYPRVTEFNYVIGVDASGTFTGWPTDPGVSLAKVTGTDFGAVVNTCVTNLLATSGGVGNIGVLPPAAKSAGYVALTKIDLQFSVGLIGFGGQSGVFVIDFSSSSGQTDAIVGGEIVQGLTLFLKANMNGITSLSAYDCAVNGNSGSGDSFISAGDGSIFANCKSTNNSNGFHLKHNTCVVSGFESSGDTTIGTIDLNKTGNIVYPISNNGSGAVVDSSTTTNYLITGLTGVLSAPSVVNTAVTNTFGTQVEVHIEIGGTGTIVTKNATAITGSVTNRSVTVILDAGESVTVSQTTAVTWTWFAI